MAEDSVEASDIYIFFINGLPNLDGRATKLLLDGNITHRFTVCLISACIKVI